jgi:hypothetical protein
MITTTTTTTSLLLPSCTSLSLLLLLLLLGVAGYATKAIAPLPCPPAALFAPIFL